MNREARRRSEKSVKQAHQTKSFTELVSETNQKALQPYVDWAVNNAKSEIAKMVLEELGTAQTRLTVLEKIAIENGETKQSLAERILEEEDIAFNVAKSKGPVQRGDMLRISIQVKIESMDKYTPEMNVVINAVGVAPRPDIPYQTNPELEEGLIGAMPGESREIAIKLKENKDGVYRVKIDRISTPIKGSLKDPESPVLTGGESER